MRNYLQWICFMINDSNSKAFIIFTFYWCNIIYVWNIVILFKLWWKKFTSTFPFVQVNFNWHYRFSQFMETLTFPLVRIWFTHIDSSHHSQDIQKSEQIMRQLSRVKDKANVMDQTWHAIMSSVTSSDQCPITSWSAETRTKYPVNGAIYKGLLVLRDKIVSAPPTDWGIISAGRCPE